MISIKVVNLKVFLAEPAAQTNDPKPDLQSKQNKLDLAEDPNYERKLTVIDYSIDLIDFIDGLSGVLPLGLPDVLGTALKAITTILEKLKVCSVSLFICRHLLTTLVRK